jgi:hypothetical protein
VTDPVTNLSCTDQVIVDHVTPISPIQVTLPSNYSVDCCAPTTTLNATISMGTGTFQFLWNSTTSLSVNNLNSTIVQNPTIISCIPASSPANFYVTITSDINQCQASAMTTVTYNTCPNPPGIASNDPIEPTTDYMDRSYDNDLELKVEIAPNPNNGAFNLYIQSGLHRSPTIHLIDLSGRILYTQVLSIQKGLNQIEISKPELPSGVYFIKVDGFDEPIKMIITK